MATGTWSFLRMLFGVGCLLGSIGFAHATPATDWLHQQSQSSGVYQSDTPLATDLQATSEAVVALEARGLGDASDVALARDYFDSRSTVTTEELARRIRLDASLGEDPAAAIERLRQHQNRNGGFGDRAGYSSTVLDTTWALEALAIADAPDSIPAAVGFLLDRQQSDGSWSDPGVASAHYTTALTLRALGRLRGRFNLDAAIDAAHAYLLNASDSTGAIGVPYETAAAILALAPMSSSKAVYADVVDSLTARQRADGSWSGSVFTTALAIQALALAEQPQPNPELGSLAMTVVDVQSGGPIEGASVAISGAGNSNGVTDAEGVVKFNELPAGSYSVEISATGYTPLIVSTELNTGEEKDLGNLVLLQEREGTTATLHGSVVVADSEDPIAGARISISGASSGQTTTDESGEFLLEDMDAGEVQIRVDAKGYESALASMELKEGTASMVTIRLLPAESTFKVFGTVVADETGAPIAGADVSISGVQNLSTVTETDGTYEFAAVDAGLVAITVSAADYEDASAAFEGEAGRSYSYSPRLVGLGDAPGDTPLLSVQGQVLDLVSKEVVADVDVELSVDGEFHSGSTDSDGRFLLDGVVDGNATLSLSHPDYVNLELSFELTQGTSVDLGRIDLSPVDSGDTATNAFSVTDVHGMNGPFEVGETGRIEGRITNGTNEEQEVLLVATLFTLDGEEKRVLQIESGSSNMLFDAGESRQLRWNWSVGQLPPGEYLAAVRVVEPGSISRAQPLGELIARSEARVSIVESRVISGFLAFDPPILQAGAGQETAISAEIRNAGNVLLSAQDHELKIVNPDGAVVASLTASAGEMAVNQTAHLSFGQWSPEEAGNFEVVVEPANPEVESLVESDFLVDDLATGAFELERNEFPPGDHDISGSIDIRGVDVRQAASSDPLFELIKEATDAAASYTSTNARTWHRRNRCLGCHTQTQAYLGLNTLDQVAGFEGNGVQYFRNTLTSNVQGSGGVFASHDHYGITQTALALWATSADTATSPGLSARYRMAEYMHARTSVSGDLIYWPRNHPDAWWRWNDSTTAIAVQGLAAFVRSVSANEDINLVEYGIESASNVLDRQPIDLAGSADRIYALLSGDRLARVEPDGSAIIGTVQQLPVDVTHIEILSDGRLVVSSTDGGMHAYSPATGEVVGISSVEGVPVDIAVADNDRVFVATQSPDRVWAFFPGETAQIIADEDHLDQPVAVAAQGNDSVLVADRPQRSVLSVHMDGEVSEFIADLSYRPRNLAAGDDGSFLLVTDSFYSSGHRTPDSLHLVTSEGDVHRLAGLGGVEVAATVAENTIVVRRNDHALYRLIDNELERGRIETFRDNVSRASQWLLAQGNRNRTIRLALKMTALAEAKSVVDDALKGQIDTALEQLDETLRARQNSDGGWPVSGSSGSSDPLVTAAVGLALETLDPSADDPVIRESIRYLLNSQAGDGSWSSRTMSTRLSATGFVLNYLPRALQRLGGIDATLQLELPDDVELQAAQRAPDSSKALPDGSMQHSWDFQGVTSDGRTVDLDFMIHGLELKESRPIANRAQLLFDNSFTGDTVAVDLDIPLVSAPLQPGSVDVTTDAGSYAPGSTVTVSSVGRNEGTLPGDFRMALRVEDTAGVVVADLGETDLGTLAAGASSNVETSWNSQGVIAGTYEAVATLHGADGEVVDESLSVFLLLPSDGSAPVATLRTVTDAVIYEPNDTVGISHLARNTSPNALLRGGELTTVVIDPDGMERTRSTVVLGDMASGAQRERQLSRVLNEAPTGTWTVRGILSDGDGHVLAEDEDHFDVVITGLDKQLDGEVAVAHAQRYVGQPQSCTDTLTNNGVSVDVEIRRLLLDRQRASDIQLDTRTLHLNADEVSTLERSVNTGVLEPGFYTCLLQVKVDGQWANLDHADFQLDPPPIDIAGTLEAGERGRLLVLLDPPVKEGQKAEDPHGPKNSPSPSDQRAWLEDRLDEAGWSYTIVTDGDRFGEELRSAGYAAVALFNEQVKIAEADQRYLTHAVEHDGIGLFVSGMHDRRNGRVESALGLESKGKLPHVDGLYVHDSEIATADAFEFAIDDKPLRLDLQGARTLADYTANRTDKGKGGKAPGPGLTVYRHGNGHSIDAGFDLLLQGTVVGGDNRYSELLLSALDHIHPDDLIPAAGHVWPLHLVLVNEGLATPGRVVLPLPEGVTVVDPGGATVEDGTLIWPFTLDIDERIERDAWIRLPAQPGPVELQALIQTGTAPDWADHRTVTYTIDVD